MDRKRLTGLRPQAYEHPWDKKALDALQASKSFAALVAKLNEWGFERILRVQLTGSNIRVTADNFPEIYEKVQEAGAILDLPALPEVYLAGGGEINAFTAGVKKPIVVVTSAAVDLLTEEELFFVIAHELGHIKSGHVLYYQIAQFVPVLGEVVGAATLGISNLFSTGLEAALLNWKRTSEFTADRAGLLACQDVNVAISAMMKIAGLPLKYHGSINTEDFIAQAREFESMDTDTLSWLAKGLSIMGQSHPWTVMRANQFLTWIDAGEYEKVLNAPPETPQLRRFCSHCGGAVVVTAAFCTSCGARVPVIAAAPN
jgi:Zn-dependent protease with chaperone function